MRLDITGRHLDITPGIRGEIDKRVMRLERLLHEHAISAQVILTKEKHRLVSEIVVHARGDRILRGRGSGTTWPGSLRECSAKIEQQAQTLKGKWGERKREGAGTRAVKLPTESERVETTPRRVIRATRYPVKPMTIEDAALRVDGSGETFVVFRNAETDAICILFRRKDGNLGLIEPD
jgi:putative sigma-54 modulation protein